MFDTLNLPPPVRRAAMALALGAALLGGCAAPTVATRVTTFQQWPAGVEGQRYRFDPQPAQRNNLEYQAYQDMVRAGIGATGLVEAQAGESARFAVSFHYESTPTQVMQRRPYDPYFPGFYGPPWWGGPGYWGPGWIGPGWYGPGWVDVPVAAFRNTLRLEIRDTARQGTEVYRATAYLVSDRDDLVRAMPYLVRAIFDGFPGNNGAERRVEYPLNR
ncbi:DUF4136 domain-containing protein [Bordetella sp. 2513F-2]